MNIDDYTPAFVRRYPFGSGLLGGNLLIGALQLAASSNPENYVYVMLLGMWGGWILSHHLPPHEPPESPPPTGADG